jgi:hypothetical protein
MLYGCRVSVFVKVLRSASPRVDGRAMFETRNRDVLAKGKTKDCNRTVCTWRFTVTAHRKFLLLFSLEYLTKLYGNPLP